MNTSINIDISLAILDEDLHALDRLFDTQYDINGRYTLGIPGSEDYFSYDVIPLYFASILKKLKAVKFLLDKGANINIEFYKNGIKQTRPMITVLIYNMDDEQFHSSSYKVKLIKLFIDYGAFTGFVKAQVHDSAEVLFHYLNKDEKEEVNMYLISHIMKQAAI